jgi:serine protease inhibitor
MPWPFAAKQKLPLDIREKSKSPSTRFAFRLFRQLVAEPKPENIFFSPASVMLCLCLLQDGATGETREAMAKVLEVAGLEPKELRPVIVALKSALQFEGPGLRLEAANSLCCSNRWTPRPEYFAKVREDYDTEVMVLDFGNPETVTRINSWVSEKTGGRIESILNSLHPLALLVAVNAVYFKGLWDNPFERRVTREEPFHLSDGRKVNLPLMRQYDSYPYYEESTFQAVRLGYETSRLAMYVFLPAKESSLRQFQQDLNSGAWDKWMGRFETIRGQVRLPRFKLTYSVQLNSALGKLGMEIAFDPERARFDNINPPPPSIWLDQVLHRAFVEVNEEGTEAAAVTAAMAVLSSSEKYSKPPRTFEMIVDRPFFFAIRDDLTKTILFMGSVEEPEA